MSHTDGCHGLRLDPPVREDARRRLLSVKGHVEGILRMLENVDGALNKIGDLILKSHLRNHVVTAHERGDEDRVVDELMEILKYR